MRNISLDSGSSRLDCAGRQMPSAAFSITELLAMLGILTLLFLLQTSAVAHNKGNSHRAVCADNLRRLGLSWLMYADDNRGGLAPNLDGAPANATNNWVGGVLDFSGPDNTNTATITRARLYPYNKSVEIYRCPEDLSAVRGQTRIRSYSMNGWVGDEAVGWISGFQVMTNRSQIRQPNQTFVVIEEHPNSINDGIIILIDRPLPGSTARLIDFPAAYHYYGANVVFADGSVQYRRWIDPRTSPSRPTFGAGPTAPGDPDLVWMQSISTYRK